VAMDYVDQGQGQVTLVVVMIRRPAMEVEP
jgi:hypothetical protein